MNVYGIHYAVCILYTLCYIVIVLYYPILIIFEPFDRCICLFTAFGCAICSIRLKKYFQTCTLLPNAKSYSIMWTNERTNQPTNDGKVRGDKKSRFWAFNAKTLWVMCWKYCINVSGVNENEWKESVHHWYSPILKYFEVWKCLHAHAMLFLKVCTRRSSALCLKITI